MPQNSSKPPHTQLFSSTEKLPQTAFLQQKMQKAFSSELVNTEFASTSRDRVPLNLDHINAQIDPYYKSRLILNQ